MKKILEVSNLSVSYHGKTAFENISFGLDPGQLVGIIGPNGSGKSTLLKAILGLVPCREGRVKVLGRPVDKARKNIAYVPQRSDIDLDFPLLVEDVVALGRYAHLPWWGLPRLLDRQVVKKCLQEVEMYGLRRRQIGQLSGGQQQRVFLARALAQEAQLLFLDEPFAGIDLVSENLIMELLQKLRDQGKTLLVVHHDLGKAEKYFDRLVLLKNRLVAWGSREEVFQLHCLREAYDGRVATLASPGGALLVNG